MTNTEVSHWLWALAMLLDNQRALAYGHAPLRFELTQDMALQVAGACDQAARVLSPLLTEEDEEDEEPFPLPWPRRPGYGYLEGI